MKAYAPELEKLREAYATVTGASYSSCRGPRLSNSVYYSTMFKLPSSKLVQITVDAMARVHENDPRMKRGPWEVIATLGNQVRLGHEGRPEGVWLFHWEVEAYQGESPPEEGAFARKLRISAVIDRLRTLRNQVGDAYVVGLGMRKGPTGFGVQVAVGGISIVDVFSPKQDISGLEGVEHVVALSFDAVKEAGADPVEVEYFEAKTSIRGKDGQVEVVEWFKDAEPALDFVKKAYQEHSTKAFEQASKNTTGPAFEESPDVLAGQDPDSLLARKITWAKDVPKKPGYVTWHKDYFYVTRKVLTLK